MTPLRVWRIRWNSGVSRDLANATGTRVWTRPALWIFVALAAAPLAAKLGAEAYILSLATRALIFSIAALSLDFIVGHGALVSLGHAAFLGIGAYSVAILSGLGQDEIVVQLAAAILAAVLFALATGAISLRASGVYYIMSTLAFGQMLYFFFVSLSALGGDDGMTLDARSRLFGASVLRNDVALYYFALLILVAAYVLTERIVGSRFGRVLGAIRQNPLRARAIGFQPFGYKLTACAISAALCATAGVLLADQSEFVSPAFMTWQRSGELLVMAILGGVGSLWGAILGAFALLMLEEFLSRLTEQGNLILGPVLVLVALMGRGGLAGLVERLFASPAGAVR